MSDTPNDKLAANSQAPKSMGGGANHPFEAGSYALHRQEPPGIQANREQMGYPLSELILEAGGDLVVVSDMPELVTTGDIVAYYDGQGNIVVESPQANNEHEELRLLREYYQLDRRIYEGMEKAEAWGKLVDDHEKLHEQIQALRSPSHSGAVGLPAGEGRLDE